MQTNKQNTPIYSLRGNKRFLINLAGFKSIRSFLKMHSEFTSTDDVYNFLKNEHNMKLGVDKDAKKPRAKKQKIKHNVEMMIEETQKNDPRDAMEIVLAKNKSYLLEENGIKAMQTYLKYHPEFKTDAEAYDHFLTKHNDRVKSMQKLKLSYPRQKIGNFVMKIVNMKRNSRKVIGRIISKYVDKKRRKKTEQEYKVNVFQFYVKGDRESTFNDKKDPSKTKVYQNKFTSRMYYVTPWGYFDIDKKPADYMSKYTGMSSEVYFKKMYDAWELDGSEATISLSKNPVSYAKGENPDI